jgi:hypothetical protein
MRRHAAACGGALGNGVTQRDSEGMERPDRMSVYRPFRVYATVGAFPMLYRLLSVTSSIRESGAAIQWTADTTVSRNQRTLITVTIELTRLRSAVISIAEKDVGSLTSPLPFMRPAPTCLTLAMLTMTTAYLRILGTNGRIVLGRARRIWQFH